MNILEMIFGREKLDKEFLSKINEIGDSVREGLWSYNNIGKEIMAEHCLSSPISGKGRLYDSTNGELLTKEYSLI